jgi:hypothetical protein
MVDVLALVYRSDQEVPQFERKLPTASSWNCGSWIESVDNKQLTQIEFLKWALQLKAYFSVGSLDQPADLLVFQMVSIPFFFWPGGVIGCLILYVGLVDS